eukprot:3533928-Rhodomonas_salina.7
MPEVERKEEKEDRLGVEGETRCSWRERRVRGRRPEWTPRGPTSATLGTPAAKPQVTHAPILHSIP